MATIWEDEFMKKTVSNSDPWSPAYCGTHRDGPDDEACFYTIEEGKFVKHLFEAGLTDTPGPRDIRMRCHYCGKMVSVEVQYLRHVLGCAQATLDEVSHQLQAFETGGVVRAHKRDGTYMRYEVVNGKMQATRHTGPVMHDMADGTTTDGPIVVEQQPREVKETSEDYFRKNYEGSWDPKQDPSQR